MPITKTIPEEIEALEFAIKEFSEQAKNNYGQSDGQISKRERLRDAIIAFNSIKSRLTLIEARKSVVQPTLFNS